MGKARAFVRRTSDRSRPTLQLDHIRCSTRYGKTLPASVFFTFWRVVKAGKSSAGSSMGQVVKAHGLALAAAAGLYHWSEPMISRSCAPNAAASASAKVNVASSWSPSGLAMR